MIFQSFITISITKHLNLVFVCACLRTLPHIFCILAHVRSCASRLYLSASVVCKHDLFANICVCSHLVANLAHGYPCAYISARHVSMLRYLSSTVSALVPAICARQHMPSLICTCLRPFTLLFTCVHNCPHMFVLVRVGRHFFLAILVLVDQGCIDTNISPRVGAG
ncbi:hypothetical protein EDB19DRAFT_583150 [Suillus lakei]|nr:hypothetical protein EDB19DRAFT_583150 [Suillus lakei]